MASTVLPNGIIIPEKYSRDWYNDLYHNWQELDNLLSASPGDGTLTIQKNGTTVGTFSANQATDATANIEVPTKTSDLNNDSGFITGVTWNDVSNKPSFATVATSGSYNDLNNKPTIPTVNNATLTIQKNGTNVQTFTANQSTNATANITVPTKTSDLTNDSGFITEDTTKIPLAGSNAISGSLIPSTDNSIDIGSSTKNLKMLYTKGITIDGKTVDTDANGNMTYDGHIVDTIEEQGNGYIRYSNGIQICCIQGELSGSVYTWNFPKTFVMTPVVTATVHYKGGNYNVYQRSVELNSITNTRVVIRAANHLFGSNTYTVGNDNINAIAIGRWK